jgi:multicomponent Na+:H+ antiporter subunit A
VLTNVIIVAIAGLLVIRLFFGRHLRAPKSPHEAPLPMLLGPVVLSLVGFVIGLFPQWISNELITPAVSAVRAEPTVVILTLWHGINPVLALSAVTVAMGVVVYWVHRRIRRFVWRNKLPDWTRADAMYSRSVEWMLEIARVQTKILQSGFLRRYLLVILVTVVGLGAWVFLSKPSSIGETDFPPLHAHELLLALVMVIATMMAVKAKSRLAAIVAIGIVGYGMALMFMLFSAPDLAMTQFSIETLTVIIFLLVVYRLPRFADYSPTTTRVRDSIVAITVGACMTVFVLAVLALPHWSHVSAYLVENSWPLAKGRNIVNVILVDFRALDTLGEIVVLAVAGIGAYALLKLRKKEG